MTDHRVHHLVTDLRSRLMAPIPAPICCCAADRPIRPIRTG